MTTSKEKIEDAVEGKGGRRLEPTSEAIANARTLAVVGPGRMTPHVNDRNELRQTRIIKLHGRYVKNMGRYQY